MSHSTLPPHARTVRSFLVKIGALVTRVHRGPRIVITWRLDGEHHETDLARRVSDPMAYAIGKMGEIKALTGLAGEIA